MTHIWKKFNRPNRERSSLLVWGLGVCVKARSLCAGIILDVGVRSNPMSLTVVEAIGALESETLQPPLPRGFNLLQCGLGSYGKRNYITINYLHIGVR